MRRLSILVAFTMLALPTWAITLRYSSGTGGISVSQTNTRTPFTDNHSGGISVPFKAQWVCVSSRSTSANACFYDFDGVATTADNRLAPGETACWSFEGGAVPSASSPWREIGAICATGETATFDVIAAR